jgi:uncharacterized RmlC-like cupin family protein
LLEALLLRPDGTADCPECDLPMFPLSLAGGFVQLECANRHHADAPLPVGGPLRRAVESWIRRRGAQLHEQHERWGTDAPTNEEESVADPNEIRLIRPADRTRDTLQTAGMIREAAISRSGLWAGVATTAAGMTTGWHHHGTHETAIYVRRGRIRLEFGKGGGASVDAREGDFLHVPPGAVHRESNPGNEEAEIVVVRAGTGVPVTNVEGPAE